MGLRAQHRSGLLLAFMSVASVRPNSLTSAGTTFTSYYPHPFFSQESPTEQISAMAHTIVPNLSPFGDCSDPKIHFIIPDWESTETPLGMLCIQKSPNSSHAWPVSYGFSAIIRQKPSNSAWAAPLIPNWGFHTTTKIIPLNPIPRDSHRTPEQPKFPPHPL